jgi:plastocyanin
VADPRQTHRARRTFLLQIGAIGTGAAMSTVAAALAIAQRASVPAKAGIVTIEGMQYTPATVSVDRGQTVEWVNKDLFPHTVTVDGTFDSGDIQPEGKWRFTATTAGEFTYRCKLHPTMKARLIVRDGG